MGQSHLQTRTLTDALNAVDAILISHSTQLQSSQQRLTLASALAQEPPTKEFHSWAFSAAEYSELSEQISVIAPDLAARIEPPTHPRDFTVVGHCAVDLRFESVPNGAYEVEHTSEEGTVVVGCCVHSARARRYSSGLVALPTIDGRDVYFYQPPTQPTQGAAALAATIYSDRDPSPASGVVLTFPRAATSTLPPYDWVSGLESRCGLYVVKNFVSGGDARVDQAGFFAQETSVVQVKYRSIPDTFPEVLIDGPFLVFYADQHGVHVAAWFDEDSFAVRDAH
jgi:hypothetical protein